MLIPNVIASIVRLTCQTKLVTEEDIALLMLPLSDIFSCLDPTYSMVMCC